MQNNLFRKSLKTKIFSLQDRNIQIAMQQVVQIIMVRTWLIQHREKRMVLEKNLEMGNTEDLTKITRILILMLISHLWIIIKLVILVLNTV